jgi:hypothetical protein
VSDAELCRSLIKLLSRLERIERRLDELLAALGEGAG